MIKEFITKATPQYMGMSVSISPDIKVNNFKIRDSVVLTERYRKSIDKWCLEIFGFSVTNLIDDGKVVLHNGNSLIANPRTYELLKEGMDK